MGLPMICDNKQHSMETSTKKVKEKFQLKQFDEGVISSKERLHDIISFLPDATFVIDSAGRVIAWNQAMEDLTKVKAEKIIGKNRYEYALPFYGERRKLLIDIVLSSDPKIEEKYDLIQREKSSLTAEVFIPSLNGRPTYLWGKATPLYDQKKKVTGAIESIRDVTHKKQAEKELRNHRDHLEDLVEERTEELRKINIELQNEVKRRERMARALKQSEENYRSIFENAGIGIFQSTPEGRFKNVNITMAHMFGYQSPPEMVNSIYNSGEQIYADPKRRSQILGITQKKQRIIKFENEFLRKDGEKWIGELNLRIVRNEKGTPLFIEGFIQDITSRKQTEQALQKSEAEYRTIFENTGAATLIIEADTSISLVNTEFERLFACSRNEVEGKSWMEFILEEDLKKMMDYHLLRTTDPDLAPKNYEFRFLKRNNEIGNAYMTIARIPGTSQRIASIVDITDRKKTEKELYKLNEKLKRSNTELEQFAYVASHDLQEPLRMVSSFAQLLEKNYKGQLDERAHEFIYFVIDGAQRMQALINDLLEYSRVTKDNKFEPVDLEVVLKTNLSNLKTSIEENQAQITYDPLPRVMADPSIIGQVFQNLMVNALKYRGKKPPKIHISAEKEESQFLFSVKDNGIGMPPEHLERIFVIFQRLHSRDEYEGTGMGLAIAQKIVDQHGGKIWAESEPGKGSIFYFTLPDYSGNFHQDIP